MKRNYDTYQFSARIELNDPFAFRITTLKVPIQLGDPKEIRIGQTIYLSGSDKTTKLAKVEDSDLFDEDGNIIGHVVLRKNPYYGGITVTDAELAPALFDRSKLPEILGDEQLAEALLAKYETES